MKPRVSILSRDFKYVPQAQSNIRVTFMRERRRLKLQQAIDDEQQAKVTQLKRGKA